MKDNAIECCMVYLLIRESNQSQYGTLAKGFVSQYSIGNEQYPRSIITATDALSNQKIDPWRYDNQKRNHDKLRSTRVNRETDNDGNPTSFSHQYLTCYCCGNKFNTSNYWDKRSTTPCTRWACNNSMQHIQYEEGAETSDGEDVSELSADKWLMHSTTSTPICNLRNGNRNRRNQEHTQGNENPRP